MIFSFNEFGKPFIQDNKYGLQFNLSHCDDLIVFAFSRGNEIGVDIERIKKMEDMEGVANLCFTKFETEWMKNSKSSIETFYKIWTIKEAFIKAIGRGFSFSPKDIELVNETENKIAIKKILQKEFALKFQVTTLNILPDYIASLVYLGKKDIEIYDWESDISLLPKEP